jgi:hypothetical protein
MAFAVAAARKRDFYVPEPTVPFKGIEGFLQRYQAKAPSIGAHLLGYFIPAVAYANGQVIEQFKKTGTQVIIHPPELASGKLQFPYSEGR